MPEIIAAIDEGAATTIFTTLAAGLPPQSSSGSSSFGPFTAGYSATATLSSPGTVDLIPPGTIRVADLRLDWQLHLSLSLDIGDFLPDIHIPCVGDVCTPKIDIVWPTVTVPINLSDYVRTTVDLGIAVTLVAGTWKVEGVVQGVPNLQFGLTTAAMRAGVGAAGAAAVAWVPLIGPFLAVLVAAVVAAIGVAGLTGLLGPILTPFISGTRFPVYSQPQVFTVLPAAGANDPVVTITLDAIGAEVQHNPPEDELVLSADISA